MAYHGGTDNPLVANSGNPATLNVGYFSADPCAVDDTITIDRSTAAVFSPFCYVTLNDPGYVNQPLDGYAFLPNDASELEASLRQAIDTIQHQSYSFSQSSIASSRVADENFIYEASFQPNFFSSKCPFWIGAPGEVPDQRERQRRRDGLEKRRHKAAAQGLGPADHLDVQMRAPSSPSTRPTSPADVAITTGTDAEKTRGATRSWATSAASRPITPTGQTTARSMKLGDIFRSSPVTVGTPIVRFPGPPRRKPRLCGLPDGEPALVDNGTAQGNGSSSPGRTWASSTRSGPTISSEVWSFIPPNGLERLKQIAHKTHPANQQHIYFVDGPISVADVWLGTGDGTAKSVADWKTLLVFGEGRGANKVLWSNSSNCETGFSNMYKSANGHIHYCGYYALDITNTLAPAFKWRITPTDAGAPYLGDPWSKIMIHRVKINGNEKWVGFLGGGHQLSVCNGTRLRQARQGVLRDRPVQRERAVELHEGRQRRHGLCHAGPARHGRYRPGRVHRHGLYRGPGREHLALQILLGHRRQLLQHVELDRHPASSQRAGGTGAVYAAPAVAKDPKGNLWLYWGTGDRLEPISVGGGSERIYAVKDTGSTVTIGNLENVTSSTYADTDEKRGWYIILAGNGEKVLAEPVVFGGVAYFTSYIPSIGGDVCQQGQGTASLYALGYLTAASATGTGNRSIQVGYGIPTAPIVSFRPGGAGRRPVRDGQLGRLHEHEDGEDRPHAAHAVQPLEHALLARPAGAVRRVATVEGSPAGDQSKGARGFRTAGKARFRRRGANGRGLRVERESPSVMKTCRKDPWKVRQVDRRESSSLREQERSQGWRGQRA